MERIVDIAQDGQAPALHRGFLVVGEDRVEVGRIALDDVHAVIVHAHGTTWSANLVATLAERGAPLVFCNAAHAPVAIALPLAGHPAQNARFRAQWDASRPLMKQAWRRIVSAKIAMQGALLSARGVEEGAAFDLLARRVKSGDPDNVEAQAARRYWPLLMGADFRRDRDSPGANALLNYGYAVMRATVARAICAAGLHPTIGIAHANRGNPLALADDLIEPFRPLVDALVVATAEGHEMLDPALKRRFARLIAFDLRIGGEASPCRSPPSGSPSRWRAATKPGGWRSRCSIRRRRSNGRRSAGPRCQPTSGGVTGATYLSGYRLMWIFVMFDLPVVSKKQARDATKFREFLLDEGFEMSQFLGLRAFLQRQGELRRPPRPHRAQPAGEGRRAHPDLHRPPVQEHGPILSQRRQKRRANPDQLALF
ncbi:type II CRISPR-associated endonuclease Cas1 [Sphingomonas sp. MMS24-JH45]